MSPSDKQGVHPEKLDKNMKLDTAAEEPMTWHSPKGPPFRLAGFAWFAQDGVYRRLPVGPPCPIPDAVDSLANCTAGGQVQFQTNSTRLFVRVKLLGPASMDHMPPTGQCGFDCYIGPPTAQRYCRTTRFGRNADAYEGMFFDNFPAETRNVTINFPLYQGVDELLVGLAPDAQVLPPPAHAREGRSIVYGTSITQGGCASRPGMLPTNILSRRLNVEFVNLGFSGSGRGEPEVAKTITEIADPLCYVLDYEANCQGIDRLRETLPEFIRILREAQPAVPIVVMPRTNISMELFDPNAVADTEERRAFQRETVESLRAGGDENIMFLDASTFFGEDFDECTVDGGHPTDLGFLRIANGMTPLLKELLLGG